MTTQYYLDIEADAIAVLGLAVDAGEVRADSLLLLFADDTARFTQPVAVDEVPSGPPQDERIRALLTLLEGAVETGGVRGALLAVARTGRPDVSGDDLAWHDAFASTARIAGLDCHGTYLVTPHGITKVHPPRQPVAA